MEKIDMELLNSPAPPFDFYLMKGYISRKSGRVREMREMKREDTDRF